MRAKTIQTYGMGKSRLFSIGIVLCRTRDKKGDNCLQETRGIKEKGQFSFEQTRTQEAINDGKLIENLAGKTPQM